MKNKGITLIALVITIIILLILAGIAISQLTGSGLFENSRLAKEKYDDSGKRENSILGEYENQIVSYSRVGTSEENPTVVGKVFGIDLNTQGEGTESSPYIVTNKEQLEFLASWVNRGNTFEGKYIKLGNDITLDNTKNWIPIGIENKVFKGTFDGDNHKIKGLYFNSSTSEYVGLFGNVEDSTIKNIIVSSENSSSINAQGFAGAVVGYAVRGNIYNCVNQIAVTGNNSSSTLGQTGGIVGFARGTYIKDCSNSGNVTSSYSGGIIGYYVGENSVGGECKIENCSNTGTISSSQTNKGGIAGRIWSERDILIKGCSTTTLNLYGTTNSSSYISIEN